MGPNPEPVACWLVRAPRKIAARVAWLGRAIALALVAALAAGVSLSADVSRLDLLTVSRVHAHAFEPVTGWILAITALGGIHTVVPLTAVAVAGLAAVRQWRGAVTLALAVAATQLTVPLIKVLIERPRPPGSDALAEAHGYSFPSGHAATAVALYALLALLCAAACRGRVRGAIALAGAGIALAVGLSRLYLGVHYPTDVVAGWLIGGALALLSWAVASRLGAPRGGRAAA